MENYSAESCRRLMDMLAGWSEFAIDDEFAGREFQSIVDLYNASANCMTNEDVKKFVSNRIIPLLLDGSQD